MAITGSTTYLVDVPTTDLDVTNDDRARWAAALVQLFASHVGSDCLGQAARDLVTNIGHLADRLPPEEVEDFANGWTGEEYLNAGLAMYCEERDRPD